MTRLPQVGDLFRWIPPDELDKDTTPYTVWLLLDIQDRRTKLQLALNQIPKPRLVVLDTTTLQKTTISLPWDSILECYVVIQSAV
jgi:hypothetical protein